MILNHKLVIAVSSRALFDLTTSHDIFLKGLKEYEEHQTQNKDVPLDKGHAFDLIEKFLKLNTTPDEHDGTLVNAVEVVVVSQNSFTTGRRIKTSLDHHKLPITRMIFTSGDNPAEYICHSDLNIHLFLSHNDEAVNWALKSGIPAAIIMSSNKETISDEIRIAFDGDAILFSDESEKLFQKEGLTAFQNHEVENQYIPLGDGTFKRLFEGLSELKNHFPSIIKIGLFTARGGPASNRVLNSFDHWGLQPTHGAFLGGLSKRHFLAAFKADLFIDDHPKHCEEAKNLVSTAHAPYGGANNG